MTANIALSKLTCLVLLAIVCGVPTSHATPMVWQLRDVTFDGGSVSGSFVYDAQTTKVLAWNIVAQGGSIDVSFADTAGCTDPSACDSAHRMFRGLPVSDEFIFTHGDSASSNASLGLVTSRPLSDGGGLVSLITGKSPGGSYLSCCESALQIEVMSGMLAAMPEPASLLCLFAGLQRSRGCNGLRAARHVCARIETAATQRAADCSLLRLLRRVALWSRCRFVWCDRRLFFLAGFGSFRRLRF